MWFGGSTASAPGPYPYHQIICFVRLQSRHVWICAVMEILPVREHQFSRFGRHCAIDCAWNVFILVGSVSSYIVSVPGIPRFRSLTWLCMVLSGANVTLTTDNELCITFSWTVMLFSVTNIGLNSPTVFDNNLVSGLFAMRADSVIYTCSLSMKTCCPGLNCGVCYTDLSWLRS